MAGMLAGLELIKEAGACKEKALPFSQRGGLLRRKTFPAQYRRGRLRGLDLRLHRFAIPASCHDSRQAQNTLHASRKKRKFKSPLRVFSIDATSGGL